MMKKVAVIILNWNGAALLSDFLPSVIQHTDPNIAQIIVADNASTDSSLEKLNEFPGVEVMRFEENYGFAGGYNRAIQQTEAEIIVLLNSDVEVTAGWLEPLIAVLDKDATVAAVQPKIKSWHNKTKFEYAGACGGYIDKYGFPFCRGRILDITETDSGQYDAPVEVFWCSGAALCIRKQVYQEMGGLDERFFAHMEEIDLCWRMRNRGWSLKVVPRAVVYHLGGGSLPMNHPRKLFLNYRNNLLMLYKNMTSREHRKVMRIRFCLDISASLLFLLKGQWTNTRSIFRAYRAYYQIKKYYCPSGSMHKDSCIYDKSLIFQHYFRKNKTFQSLWNKPS